MPGLTAHIIHDFQRASAARENAPRCFPLYQISQYISIHFTVLSARAKVMLSD